MFLFIIVLKFITQVQFRWWLWIQLFSFVDLPSEKYFKAKTKGSSSSFFLLSCSAILRLRLLLRVNTDWSLRSELSESDKFSCVAMSTLLKTLETQSPPQLCFRLFKGNSKSSAPTVCYAPAQWRPSAEVLHGSCSLFWFVVLAERKS